MVYTHLWQPANADTRRVREHSRRLMEGQDASLCAPGDFLQASHGQWDRTGGPVGIGKEPMVDSLVVTGTFFNVSHLLGFSSSQLTDIFQRS